MYEFLVLYEGSKYFVFSYFVLQKYCNIANIVNAHVKVSRLTFFNKSVYSMGDSIHQSKSFICILKQNLKSCIFNFLKPHFDCTKTDLLVIAFALACCLYFILCEQMGGRQNFNNLLIIDVGSNFSIRELCITI